MKILNKNVQRRFFSKTAAGKITKKNGKNGLFFEELFPSDSLGKGQPLQNKKC